MIFDLEFRKHEKDELKNGTKQKKPFLHDECADDQKKISSSNVVSKWK